MHNVYIGQRIKIDWTVYKGLSQEKEAFDRAEIRVFLSRLKQGDKVAEKLRLLDGQHDADASYITNIGSFTQHLGKISIELDNTLEPGVYGIKAIWTKNHGRSISYCEKAMLFAVTEYVEEAENPDASEATLSIKSSTATYGLDGLSAYETAVLRDKTWLTEDEWLENYLGVKLDAENGTISFGGRTFKLTEINIPVVLKTEYGVPEVTLTYSKVGASGGSVSPNLSYKQKKTETYSNGNVVETYITTGGEITYTGDCNESGIVTVAASTVTAEHKVGEVRVTVTMNGKSGGCTAYVFQTPYTAPQPEYFAYYGFGNAMPDTIDETSRNYYPLPTDEPVKVTTQFSDKAKVHWVAYKNTAGVNLQKALDFEDDDITANVGTVVKGTWVIHYISMSIYISNTTKFYLV